MSLTIDPDYEDAAKFKFGMGELHLPYNLLIITIGIGLLYVQLQRLNTLDRNPLGTDPGAVAHYSMLLNTSAALAVSIVLAFGPMSAFYICLHLAARTRKNQLKAEAKCLLEEKAALETELNTTNLTQDRKKEIQKSLDAIYARLAVIGKILDSIDKQQTWPWTDKPFLIAAALFIAVFVILRSCSRTKSIRRFFCASKASSVARSKVLRTYSPPK